MIDKYNAFISYRHAPLDSKIAAHVQKSLERFHIPDKIRKSTGKKRIERIFRDKDELPITSDLTETISGALENSDYLIVICSENTKESFWVKREIEYFLKSHSRDRVLTVLAGGEPQDVIPEALLTQERTFTDENGVEHTVKAPLEPLSCDYRLPMRKADKEELPRLASAVIGCSYDELMNRRRAYTIRRVALLTTLLFALMLALVVYMDHTNKQIQENLDKAIRARSVQLARESMNLYEEGDRIEALHVALASVPEGYPDAPVCPETMRALIDSTGAYDTLSGLEVIHTWNYYMPSNIVSYELNEEGDRLAARDTEGNLYVWNTATHELLMSMTPDSSISTQYAFVGDTTLILIEGDANTAYDVDSAEVIWSVDDEGSDQFCGNIDDSHFALVNYSSSIRIIDSSDGSVVHRYPLGDDVVVIDSCINEDGTKVAYIGVTYDGYYLNTYFIGCLDLNSGEIVATEPTGSVISDIAFLSDGELCYAEYTLYNTNFISGDVDMYFENEVLVKKVSSSDLSPIWENTFVYLGYGSDLHLMELGSGGGVCAYSGALCQSYDIASGEVLHTFDMDDYIIDVSDNDEDGTPLLITEQGRLVYQRSPDTNDVIFYEPLVDGITSATVNDGLYVCRDQGDYLMYYDVSIYDENIQLTDDLDPLGDYDTDSSMGEDCLVIYNEYYDGRCTVVFIDCLTNEVRGEVELDDEDGSASYKFLGVYGDKAYLYKTVLSTGSIVAIDLDDQDMEETHLTDNCFFVTMDVHMDGPMVCIPLDREAGYKLLTYNVETEETQLFDTYEFTDEYPVPHAAPVYIEGADMVDVCYSDMDDNIYEFLVNVKTEEVIVPELPDDWAGIHNAIYDSVSDTIILSDDHYLVRLDEDGELVDEISTGGRTVLCLKSMKINGEDLILVVYNDGSLARYAASDMSFIGSTYISGYYNMIGMNTEMRYIEDQGLLYIQIESKTDVIDVSAWFEIATLSSSLGYNEAADGFFEYFRDPETTEVTLGFFKRYTVDELIEMGTSYLDGSVLPEYRRARYGI